MNKPLVSVVITTYKGSSVIERAVESVRNQSYTPIEIIVVDDNGLGTVEQEKTQKIIQRYESIQYIPHIKNLNGSAARNTGIKAAKGEYIALLDDDDCFLPQKIEKQYEAMVKNKATICYSGLKIIFPNGVERDIIPTQEGNIHNLVLQRKIEAPTSVLMFTREAALKIDGFDESFQRHQDWEFLDRLSKNNKMTCVHEICLVRNIVDRNVAKNTKQFEIQRIYYLKKMKPYLSTLDIEGQKEVYYYHYAEIMRVCLKAKDFKRAIVYFIKAGQPIRLLRESFSKYRKYRERL